MQIAEILSDLDTLRVCDAPVALALVSASTTTTYPFIPTATSAASATKLALDTQQAQSEGAGAGAAQDDPDLTRAKDLIALHELFKGAGEWSAGKMAELREARGLVEKAVRGL